MLVKYRKNSDVETINNKHYYIVDNMLDAFVEGINKKTAVVNDLNSYIDLFDIKGVLLVLEERQKDLIRNKQSYYRIYNGAKTFWGEVEDFERL